MTYTKKESLENAKFYKVSNELEQKYNDVITHAQDLLIVIIRKSKKKQN